MESRIKFEIGSTFNGDGFRKAQAALDRTSKGVQKAGGVMASLGGALGEMGGKIGTVAKGVGDLLGSFAIGGPLGLAVAGITAVVGLMVKWRNSIEEARKAHQEQMRAMEEGYKRRLAEYAEKARKAQEAALDVAIRKGQQAIDRIRSLAAAYRDLGKAEDSAANSADRVKIANIDNTAAGGDARAQAAAAIEKQNLVNAQNMRAAGRVLSDAVLEEGRLKDILKEQRKNIELMRQRGLDVVKAELELRTTEVALSAAVHNRKVAEDNLTAVSIEGETAIKRLRQQAQKVEEDLAHAKQQEAEALEKKAKAEADAAAKQDAENRTKDVKTSGEYRLAALDAQIAQAQQAARTWEEAAQKMRGKNFRDWLAEDKAAAGSGDAFAKANASDAKKAQRIRANSRHGWASARELAWLGQYDKWSAAQDPANNAAQKTLEKLQEERAQTVTDIKKSVEQIQEDLKKAVTVE